MSVDADTLLGLMRTRRSIRRFADRPLPRALMDTLIEAARWAPSNHNRQGVRFIVFEDRQQIEQLAWGVRSSLMERLRSAPALLASVAAEFVESASWFGEAPVLILVLHKRVPAVARGLLEGAPDPALVSGEPLSAAMAVQNMLLMARTIGLGACVLTAPLLAHDVVGAIPGLPPGHDPTCLVAVGYPAEEPAPPQRKRLERLVEFRERR